MFVGLNISQHFSRKTNFCVVCECIGRKRRYVILFFIFFYTLYCKLFINDKHKKEREKQDMGYDFFDDLFLRKDIYPKTQKPKKR